MIYFTLQEKLLFCTLLKPEMIKVNFMCLTKQSIKTNLEKKICYRNFIYHCYLLKPNLQLRKLFYIRYIFIGGNEISPQMYDWMGGGGGLK